MPSAIDARMDDGATFEHELEAGANAFLLVLEGSAIVGRQERPGASGELAWLTRSEEAPSLVTIKAGGGATHLLLFAGMPLREPGPATSFRSPKASSTARISLPSPSALLHGRSRLRKSSPAARQTWSPSRALCSTTRAGDGMQRRSLVPRSMLHRPTGGRRRTSTRACSATRPMERAEMSARGQGAFAEAVTLPPIAV
jgi:Pirin C-terminal cupin domain